MPTPLQEQYKRAFAERVRASAPQYGVPDGAFDQTLQFATFREALTADRIADVVKNLRAVAILMQAVTAAEIATIHEHLDDQGPALSQDECDEHRAAFTEIRNEYVHDLELSGVQIDLEAYASLKAKEFVESGAPDPCRVLEQFIVSVRRGLGYQV